jgi:hypothetical protein
MNRTIRRSITTLAAALVVATPLAACSDDDGSAAEVPEGPTTTEDPTPGEADDLGDSNTIEVTLADYGFPDLPLEAGAGTRLAVVNAGAELHELVAFRLPDDEERPVEELLALPEEELTALLGPPATVLLAAPGGEQIEAVGDGTLAEPGRYAILCFIPTGVDTEAYLEAAATSDGPPDVPGGPPHFVHGMHAELLVG